MSKKKIRYKNTKHGLLVGRGERIPKIYTVWTRMKQNRPNLYICERWLNFKNFYNDMNKSMEKHIKKYGKDNTTFYVINKNGSYCLENCRWATAKEQSNNNGHNRIIKYKDKEYTFAKFCEEYKISPGTVYFRLNHGWTMEEIVDKKNCFKHKLLKKKKFDVVKSKKEFVNEYKNKIYSLKPMWQMIIIYRFGLKDNILRTLEETGKKFGLSRERIRQIEFQSLSILAK